MGMTLSTNKEKKNTDLNEHYKSNQNPENDKILMEQGSTKISDNKNDMHNVPEIREGEDYSLDITNTTAFQNLHDVVVHVENEGMLRPCMPVIARHDAMDNDTIRSNFSSRTEQALFEGGETLHDASTLSAVIDDMFEGKDLDLHIPNMCPLAYIAGAVYYVIGLFGYE